MIQTPAQGHGTILLEGLEHRVLLYSQVTNARTNGTIFNGLFIYRSRKIHAEQLLLVRLVSEDWQIVIAFSNYIGIVLFGAGNIWFPRGNCV